MCKKMWNAVSLFNTVCNELSNKKPLSVSFWMEFEVNFYFVFNFIFSVCLKSKTLRIFAKTPCVWYNSVIWCYERKSFSTSLFCFWKRGSKGEFPKDNLVNVATCLYAYIKIDIQQWTKTCRKWHDDIRTKSPCCNSLLWTSFLFLTG